MKRNLSVCLLVIFIFFDSVSVQTLSGKTLEINLSKLNLHNQMDIPDSIKKEYEFYKLKNGLQVLLQQDENVNDVSVEFWLKKGSRDEKQAENYGFAHFFEHVTPYGLRGQIDKLKLLKSYRTDSNAQVRKDFIRYYMKVKPKGLDLALQYTADRITAKGTDITANKVESERIRVLNEIKRNLKNPFGNAIAQMVFNSATFGKTHPYGHGGYGTVENNKNFKLKDFQKWYERYVHPENIILFVVGNFNKRTAKTLINKHFAHIQKKKHVHQNFKNYPIIQTSKVHSLQAKFAENYLVMSWAIPKWGSIEENSFRILANILDERLKAQKPKMVLRVGSTDVLDFYQYAGHFGVFASFSDLHNQKIVENFVAAEIKKLAKSKITDSELKRAKQKEFQIVQEMMKNLGFESSRTELFGEGILFKNNPKFYFLRLQKLKKLKIKDVERVANKWFKKKPAKILIKSEQIGMKITNSM